MSSGADHHFGRRGGALCGPGRDCAGALAVQSATEKESPALLPRIPLS